MTTTADDRATRPYRQRVRAERAEATTRRIFDAAYELFLALPYDEVTLADIAAKAGVSVPTVQRRVGSKENLLRAGLDSWDAAENERRAVPPGDTRAVARVLCSRYEELAAVTARMLGLAERLPVMADALERARAEHARWLEAVFAGELGMLGRAARRRALAQLFAATEIAAFIGWRGTLRLSAAEAEHAMAASLEALVASWHDGGA